MSERFEIFVDDGCSLCRREAGWLRRLDGGRGHLRITDINDPDFAAGDHGLDFDTAMRSIYGRFPDGKVINGVDVFVAAYDAVGRGWLWSWTRWPLVRHVIDAAYRVFAARRYRRRMKQICPLPGAAES